MKFITYKDLDKAFTETGGHGFFLPTEFRMGSTSHFFHRGIIRPGAGFGNALVLELAKFRDHVLESFPSIRPRTYAFNKSDAGHDVQDFIHPTTLNVEFIRHFINANRAISRLDQGAESNFEECGYMNICG